MRTSWTASWSAWRRIPTIPARSAARVRGWQHRRVDTTAETRYALGASALVDRFRPGIWRAFASRPERKHEGDSDMPLALELGPQAAMVVLDPATRDILALVGGYGYRPGGFDRSQRAQRQPGSAFKPFIYAAAIDSQRYTAASVVNDSRKCTSCGNRRTMTRTIFAARSGCAPPWRCPSTLWPSSCYPTWAGRHSRDGHACRNHLALARFS